MTEARFLPAILLAALLGLAGCATTFPLMPTPTLYTGAQAKPLFTEAPAEVRTPPLDLLFITDRAPATSPDEPEPYTADRSRWMAFGSTTILFGEDMTWDALAKQSLLVERSTQTDLKLGPTKELGRYPRIPYPVVVTPEGMTRAPAAVDAHETGNRALQAEVAPTNTRTNRDRTGPSGCSQEIERLVGRSLRAIVDMTKLGERTFWVDCDVIQADGGTRTAAITGSFVARADAIGRLPAASGAIAAIRDSVAAISVGIVGTRPVLDLDYVEDSTAEVDMNVVMTGGGAFVEVQGTAEQTPFSRDRLNDLLALPERGIQDLVALHRRALAARSEKTFTL